MRAGGTGIRVLLAGASTPDGRALREKLEGSALPVAKLLLRDPGEAGLLTEFRGEPLLSTPLAPEALEEADLAFLCGEPEGLAALQLRAAAGTTPVVSLAPPGPGAPCGPHVWPGQGAALPAGGLVYVPGSAACLLLRLLRPLHREAGVAEAAGIVLRSVWEEGPEGLDALLAQSVALLNMRAAPRDVLREQRAFNLLPLGPDERSARQVEAVLGLPVGAVRLGCVAAPCFHGTAVAVWARAGREIPPAEAERLLREEPGVAVGEGEEVSPVAAAGLAEVRCLAPVPSGGGFWLWGAADPVSAGAAAEALRVAEAMLGGRGTAAGEGRCG